MGDDLAGVFAASLGARRAEEVWGWTSASRVEPLLCLRDDVHQLLKVLCDALLRDREAGITELAPAGRSHLWTLSRHTGCPGARDYQPRSRDRMYSSSRRQHRTDPSSEAPNTHCVGSGDRIKDGGGRLPIEQVVVEVEGSV